MSLAAMPLSACADAQQAIDGAVSSVSEQAGDVAENVTYCTAAGRVAIAVNNEDWDTAIEHGETMVANAPDDIVGDAQAVLDGARELKNGNRAVAADPNFRASADRVEDFTREFCSA